MEESQVLCFQEEASWSVNAAASVSQKLLNLANAQQEDFRDSPPDS
jgi:hypothetical protein